MLRLSAHRHDRRLPAQAIDCLLPLLNLACRALAVRTALLTYDSAVGPPGVRHRTRLDARRARRGDALSSGHAFRAQQRAPPSDGNQSTA